MDEYDMRIKSIAIIKDISVSFTTFNMWYTFKIELF